MSAMQMTRLRGNTVIYQKLLTMFYERQADAVERIRSAWDNGDRNEAQRTARTLKSLACNVGGMALFVAAEKLETGIREGEDAQYDNLLNQTEILLQELIQALSHRFRS